jgi:hypothetical protein
VEGMKRPPTHPAEPACPCCLPALGEFGEMSPHGGLLGSLGEPRTSYESSDLWHRAIYGSDCMTLRLRRRAISWVGHGVGTLLGGGFA